MERRYPPIGDYAFIADCHTAALVSRSGSIDWCCLPRIDSGSCFARLLDWERGGYFRIAPAAGGTSTRRYLEDTLVLETTFRTESGKARLTDCFTMRIGGRHHPYQQILRLVEGLEGETEMRVEYFPCFDYGAALAWLIPTGPGCFAAFGGQDGLLLSTDPPVGLSLEDRHRLSGLLRLRPGDRAYFSLVYARPEILDEGLVKVPPAAGLSRRLKGTIRWWHRWSSSGRLPDGELERQARRSALVLKGLNQSPTGAIAAAATTSLPETPGGTRNWDYRYSWIRDSCFTVRSLGDLGYVREAEGFRRFIQRSAAGSAQELQVLFGVRGQRRLYEYEVAELDGYRGARPVRIGNAAQSQLQLDMFGELLDLSWSWHQRGYSPDEDYWEFLKGIVEMAAGQWETPDRGIWEIRGEPRHFVHSKAMCWVALDRGIRLAEAMGYPAPLERWRDEADRIRRAVEERGYDPDRGVFIQAFGVPRMDAALLLLPIYGFVEYTDPRMVRTVAEIRRELERGGFLLRYADAGRIDGLEGTEGVFLACTFWLAECLARQDRLEEARRIFRQASATGNDLGLFSEEYDPAGGEMLGSFPQALTHLSLIAAAVAISETASLVPVSGSAKSESPGKGSPGDRMKGGF